MIKRYSMVLYGDEKIGKSTLSLRLIRKRGLWLSSDSTYSIADTDEFRDIVDIRPWTRLSEIPKVAQELINEPDKYDLVMLDPTSTALGDALIKFVDKYKLGAQRAPNLPEYGHYYMVMRETTALAQTMRQVPQDVIYVCHTKEDAIPSKPNINDAAAKQLYRECNLIAYMERDPGEKRKIHLQATTRIKAGTQIPQIPEGIYEADTFLSLLRNWKTDNG